MVTISQLLPLSNSGKFANIEADIEWLIVRLILRLLIKPAAIENAHSITEWKEVAA